MRFLSAATLAPFLSLAAVNGLLLSPSAPPRQLVTQRSSRCLLVASEPVPISKKSSLAELRAFIADQGLDVKTTGKGRTKAVIYEDVMALVDAQPPTPASAEVPLGEPAVSSTASSEDAAATESTAEAAAEVEAATSGSEDAGAPPDGFEWGGTF
jgi:hypothetical protein